MRHIKKYQSFNEGALRRINKKIMDIRVGAALMGLSPSKYVGRRIKNTIKDTLGRAVGKKNWDEWKEDWIGRMITADLKGTETVVNLFRELSQNTNLPELLKNSKVIPPRRYEPTWTGRPVTEGNDLLMCTKHYWYARLVREVQERGSFESARALIDEASKMQWVSKEIHLFHDNRVNDFDNTDELLSVGAELSRLWPSATTDLGTVLLQFQVTAVACGWNLGTLSTEEHGSEERRRTWNKFILDLAIEKEVFVCQGLGIERWMRILWKKNRHGVPGACLSILEKLTGTMYAKKCGWEPGAYPKYNRSPLMSHIGDIEEGSWFDTFICDGYLKHIGMEELTRALRELGEPEWLLRNIFGFMCVVAKKRRISRKERFPKKMLAAIAAAYPAAVPGMEEFLFDESIGEIDVDELAYFLSALKKPDWLFEVIRRYIKTHNETPTKVMAAARRAFTTEYDREFGDDDFSAEMGELGI